MSRVPWDPAEIGSHDPDLDEVAGELDAYALDVDSRPDPALAGRIHAALDAEPIPAAHWWQRGGLLGPRAARLLAAAVVVAVGVLGGLALGELADVMQQGGTGSSPSPIVSPSASPTETPSPSPSPTPTLSPTPSPTPTVAPAATPTDEIETPEPDGDNSGPGGGGNSGPGGGGGDNSGPGGG